jgi:hypothetical protein
MHSLFKLFMFNFLVSFFLISCEDDYCPTIQKKTVIVYMVADNDLSDEAFDDINEMEYFFEGKAGNLIVYIDFGVEAPRIIKVRPDQSDEIVSGTVISYPQQNSASPTVLRAVIDDVMELYPSESYGLILWSHATGWLPPAYNTLKSFGLDKNLEMDILDLEEAIPDKTFEYIIFDACLMGSVEVVYQLRYKAPFILASPTEILADGFPYSNIVTTLFDENESIQQRLENIANEYMDYYMAQSGKYKSASISLIQTNALDELASKTSELLSSYSLQKWEYKQNVTQRLDLLESVLAFDFEDFLYNNYPDTAVVEVKQQLNNAVLYKEHTEAFLIINQIHKFCGLSCYIPQVELEKLNNYYKKLSWYKDSGFNLLFAD